MPASAAGSGNDFDSRSLQTLLESGRPVLVDFWAEWCGPCIMTNDAMHVRAAEELEIAHLAQLWYDGWQDAHVPILPAALARLRTRKSFEDRLRAALQAVRVVGPHGAPVGFCMVKGDELDQLFVAAESRGSGVAAALLADGEARISAQGVDVARLACAIGNERAAKFYEKHGWQRVGTVVDHLDTSSGIFPLEVWRYEKRLAR